MAGSKRTCSSCGNRFIGRAGTAYCSAACRQRAHRSRGGASRNARVTPSVTATQASSVQRSGHSAEALAVLAALDEELAENAADHGLIAGEQFGLSAAEEVVRGLVADAIDRKVDLQGRYEASQDDTARVKLSGELRLLEQSIARLLKQVKTELPAAPSIRSQKASRAANARWRRGSA